MNEVLLGWTHRYVYAVGNVVTKLGCPHDMMSGGQNRLEALQWGVIQAAPFAHLYAPVIDYAPDGSWLTMPLYQQADPYSRHIDTMRSLLGDYGIDEYDLTTHNLAVDNGCLVIVDYGYSSEMNRIRSRRDFERTFCGQCEYCERNGHNG